MFVPIKVGIGGKNLFRESAARESRNNGCRLIGVRAFEVAGTHCRRDIIIGCASLDCCVRVAGACQQRRIQLAIRPTRPRSAINIVANYGRGARVPRETDAMLFRCLLRTIPAERLCQGYIRGIACK